MSGFVLQKSNKHSNYQPKELVSQNGYFNGLYFLKNSYILGLPMVFFEMILILIESYILQAKVDIIKRLFLFLIWLKALDFQTYGIFKNNNEGIFNSNM